MAKARATITEGLALRAQASLKVRQPLASVVAPKLPDLYKDIIAEELNVKEVKWGQKLELDTIVTPQLKLEGLAREIIRYIQNARKQAGLQVDDRIHLVLSTNSAELAQAINDHQAVIKAETLASSLQNQGTGEFTSDVEVEKLPLTVKLTKAA